MKTLTKITAFALALVALAVLCTPAAADPLPGRDVLKFSQLPLDGLDFTDTGGTTTTYFGHDEFSTAMATDLSGGDPVYFGQYMADDFADEVDAEIVHVKWWGSYIGGVGEPDGLGGGGVRRFLISFETDIPDTNHEDPDTWSRPGTAILSQVVDLAPLSPGSGTFTEKLDPDHPIAGVESLYEYNAELHCPFPQEADTVYWLKIVALDLVDEINPEPISWGWHNRDYTIEDTLASVPLGVIPGEHIDGFLPDADGTPIWHFQDDAVTGPISNIWIDPTDPTQCTVHFDQDDAFPTLYLDDIDGPGAIAAFNFPGIGSYSKDLAFELYTTVPEPGTMMMLFSAGLMGLVALGRRRKRA